MASKLDIKNNNIKQNQKAIQNVNIKNYFSNPKKDYKKLSFIIIGIVVVIGLLILFFTQVFIAKAEAGDTVIVDYIGYYEGGEVFDTSMQDIGLKAELDKPSYQPLTFVLGMEMVISGFEENVIGMSKGQSKTFTLTPDKAYGEPNDGLVLRDLKRELNVTRYSIVNVSLYGNLFGEDPALGATVNRPDIPWDLRVVEINETSVKIENVLEVGNIIKIPGVDWESTIIGKTETQLFVKQSPNVGDSVSFPSARGVVSGIVSEVTENSFDIDTNHPFAGKTLTFDVTVKDVQKAK